ncbi:MAG TPA: ECF-type sigma factor, partial [Terriglobales bacterium]|nr:ECF-type sigma factor [Terriglobales bacterium]
MGSSPSDVTLLLQRYSDGDESALAELMPLIYNELRRLAASYLRRERPDHTLQTTALVHEAYLRLVDQKDAQWKGRDHFLAVAAQAMRRILVDHARRHKAVKRGGPLPRLSLEDAVAVSEEQSENLLLLDRLLTRLEAIDPQEARIIELRFFAGLSVEETASAMGISPTTVKREWSVA